MSLRPVCCCSCYSHRMRFIVGGTNGWERERSQVPDGVVERTPRAMLLLGCMVHVRVLARPELIPLVGSPALPFIDKGGGAGVYRWGKRKNTKSVEGPLRDPSLPSSPRLPCLSWQTVSEVAYPSIFVGHALAFFSKWGIPSRPRERRVG